MERNCRKEIRLTQKELTMLKAKAENKGMNVTQYIVYLIKGDN